MYLLGDGIKQDYSQAQKWFLAAANQGESNAQFHLGKIYKDGLGVDKNLSLARTWFEKSAEAGNSYAAQELSKMN